MPKAPPPTSPTRGAQQGIHNQGRMDSGRSPANLINFPSIKSTQQLPPPSEPPFKPAPPTIPSLVPKNAASAESIEEAVHIPRMYQKEIFEQACSRNIIAVIDTGSGKTMIATMLLEHINSQTKARGDDNKLSFFLVPSVPLVYQQHHTITTRTQLNCKPFCGETPGVDLWDRARWLKQLDIKNTDVVVCTPQILLNVVAHGYLSLENMDCIVLDEVHHCRKSHPYSIFFQNYFHKAPQAIRDRIKVLGLTASPIYNPDQPMKSLHELQAKTTCTILAVRSNEAELKVYAPKPAETIVYYKPGNALPDTHFAREMKVLWTRDVQFGKLNHEKAEIKAKKASDMLGPLGLDHYLFGVYDEVIKDAHKTAVIKDEQNKGKMSLLKFLRVLLDDRGRTWPISLTRSQVSKKVERLAQVLSDHHDAAVIAAVAKRKHDLIDLEEDISGLATFQCIIFVQERHIAFTLAWMLQRMPQVQRWISVRTLVGHGGATHKNIGEIGESSKNQRDVVRDFKNKHFNVLVSTSVGEEGLDFPACDLVVRFDFSPTLISMIQSRGRARNLTSHFVVLVNEDNPTELDLYEKFSGVEPELKQVYKQSAASAPPPPESANLHTDSSLRTEYKVHSTGAHLSYEMAVALVHQVCALLPSVDGIAPPPPAFLCYSSVQQEGLSRFAYDLTLPSATIIAADKLKIRGSPRSTKAEAKRAVAFEACKLLHKQGLLDDYLMPFRVKRLETEVPAFEDGFTRPDVVELIDVEVDATWGNIWTSKNAFIHPISVDGQVLLGLVSEKPLSSSNVFKLWHGVKGDVPVNVDVLTSISLQSLVSGPNVPAALQKLDAWTRQIIGRFVRPHWEKQKPLACLFVPLKNSNRIDWQKVDSLFTSLCDSKSFDRDNNVAFDPYWRPLRIECARPDLQPDSRPIQVEQPEGAAECREEGYSSYVEYAAAKLLRDMTTFTFNSEDKEMLQARLLERRRNNLIPRSKDTQNRLMELALTLEREKVTSRIIMIGGLCKFSNVSIKFYQHTILLPSVMRCIVDYERIMRVAYKLGLESIDYNVLHESLTPPAAMYGHDYQRLETMGDSVLKVCTTVHLYHEYPEKHEGHLSIMRANFVSNRFLRGQAFDAGLGSAVIMEPVIVTRWEPPSFDNRTEDGKREKRTINRKWLQDSTEGTLGACFFKGGFPLALEYGKNLQLEFGGSEMWATRYRQLRASTDFQLPKEFEPLQKLLGYKFRDPALCVEAFTHPSYVGSETAPYQRLEYLGDAILDFIVLRRFFREHPNAPPGDLTHLKQSLVAVVPLCFLSVKHLELHKYLIHSSKAVGEHIIKSVEMFKNVSGSEVLAFAWSYNPPKMTSDLIESCVGAIFVDCGYDIEMVDKIMMPLLEPLFTAIYDAPRVDPVGSLWRWAYDIHRCQKIEFRIMERTKERPEAFPIDVLVHGKIVASGGDLTRKIAKNRAAWNALEKLQKCDDVMKEICKCRSVLMEVEDKEQEADVLF